VKIRLAALLAGLACCAWGAALAADVVSFKVLKLEGNSVRWRPHEQGQRIVVSYGLVGAASEFSGARNCRKMTSLEGLLVDSKIEAAAVRDEIAAAFAMWQSVSDITFREAPRPEEADILIGAQVEPEGWAFADVFYDASRPEPVKPISKALICLNPMKRWKIGFDGDFKIYDLRYTIAHEIGHAIGLDHPSGAGQIMGYRYEERFRALQPGDVAGAVLLYGARPPDAVIATAEPPVGTVQRYAASRRFAKRWGSRAFTAPSR
jgi:matrixin